MAELFRNKKIMAIFLGILVMVILGGVLLINSLTSKTLNEIGLESNTGSDVLSNPKTVEEAVSLAIKAQGKGYGEGEVVTEGHEILDTEGKDGKVKVYTIASIGWFGFENGIFTKVSGSGAIPTVITFVQNEKEEYILQEYQEPRDGAGNLQSTKKLFPQRLWDKVLSGRTYYQDLIKQQEQQAAEYLSRIGREAEVSADYVKKELIRINVEASNKLFAEFTKYNEELNKFPYWQGTTELLEDGKRYIFETSQSKTSEGLDLVIFQKKKEDGTLVKEYRYKIVGNEPQLMNEEY